MLLAWGVYVLVPLHIGRLWLWFIWVFALVSGALTLLALIGARASLLEKASDVAELNAKLRWMQPLCALLAATLLMLAVDMLASWLRDPSDEMEIALRRVYCTSRGRFTTTRMAQRNGKWCFATPSKNITIDIPFLGRREGYETQDVGIPVSQIPRPVALGETVNARWRSYHAIFGVADAYYQVMDIH